MLPLQQADETCLFEVPIGCERLGFALRLHLKKAHRVAKGIGLVQAFHEQRHGSAMERLIDPQHVDQRVFDEVGDVVQGGRARQTPRSAQSDKLGQYVVVGCQSLGMSVAVHGIGMKGVIGVEEAQQTGGVEEHQSPRGPSVPYW